MRIEFEEQDGVGAFRAFEGDTVLGSMVWVRASPTTVIPQHTGVEEAARGKGVARALFDALIAWARETGTKIVPQCPYVRKHILGNPEYADVLR